MSDVDSFDPKAYLASQDAPPPPPDPSVPVDDVALNQFDPQAYLAQKGVEEHDALQQRAGGESDTALAALEGFARTFSLGGSDWAETKLGIDSPERIKERMQASPIAAGTGALVGGGALGGALGIGSGATSAISKIASSGAEGALFGAGNLSSDLALGDPNVNAQKVVANLGGGFLFGSALGALGHSINAAPAMANAVDASSPEAVALAAGAPLETQAGGPRLIDAPMGKVDPNDLQSIKKAVDEARKYGGMDVELPQSKDITDAEARLSGDLQFPINGAQKTSLTSQAAKDAYNVIRELPDEDASVLRDYETLQKQERYQRIGSTIDDIAPGKDLADTQVQAGNRANQIFEKKLEDTKNDLGPQFEMLNKTPIEDIDHLQGIMEKITEKVPSVAQMFDTSQGEFKIKDYSPKWGLDKPTYDRVSDLVRDIQEEQPKNIGEVLNLRRAVSPPGEMPLSQQLYPMKSAMLDYAQGLVDKAAEGQGIGELGNETSARDVLRQWAVMEQQKGVIKKAFGAATGDEPFAQISRVKPEKIMDRIFANTATVDAAKNILSKEEFHELLANHMNLKKMEMTPEGAFSSAKFLSFLKGKNTSSALDQAFSDNPASLQRLRDLTLSSRYLPDAASINPSGTAKTVVGMAQALAKKGGIEERILDFVTDKAKEYETKAQIQEMMQGRAAQSTKLNTLKGVVNKISSQISQNAKAIFNSPTAMGVVNKAGSMMMDGDYKKTTEQLKKLNADPNALMNHVSDTTEAMYHSAPNIGQGLQTAMIKGIQFLGSKVPKPQSNFPLSAEYEPSEAQKAQFARYYNAVNQPLDAMKDVQNASLTNETMEAMQAVHPDLLQEMRSKIMETMKLEQAKGMPYAKKMALSKFMGTPLDANMIPPVMAATQASYNAPQLSDQAAPKTGRKTNLGGLKQLKVASRYGTRTEQEEEDA